MKSSLPQIRVPLLCMSSLLLTQSPGFGFSNEGLVGVGRLPADSFDQLGVGVDTLGGFFSSMWLDPASLSIQGNSQSGFTYSGTLLGLPDRGFGDGAQDFHPRIQSFAFDFQPVSPSYNGPVLPQTQIQLRNTGTLLLTDSQGSTFSGFNPDPNFTAYPKTPDASLGQGRPSLDPEGLVRMKDGSYFISDEYGPNIHHFNSAGQLVATLDIPAALVPGRGAAPPRDNFFDGNSNPDSGRRPNRGLEGLSVSPDQKLLFAMLQSPTIQDGGADNNSQNTRLLVYDLQSPSAPLVGEYVYTLTLNSNASRTRHTPVSEILALNDHELLVLERDNIGLGGSNGASIYKSIVKIDLTQATNIRGTGYDLEKGEIGQLTLPKGALPPGVTPVSRQELVDLLDPSELAKFGLTADATRTANSLSEKWEGLALIPRLETPALDDFYLLVGNDNDFKASTVFHNGAQVGANSEIIDSMILAYAITLPIGAAVNDSMPLWVSVGSLGMLLFSRQFGRERTQQ